MDLSRKYGRALLIGASVITIAATSRAFAQPAQELDAITVVATKTEEKASESLSAVSTVRQEQINEIAPSRLSDIFFGMPSVTFQERADNPGTSINIRGLQDFGRVAVVVDGARQNFQQTGHSADGTFFLDPELVGGVDVVRGPVANINGSGAIGGVVAIRTKDVEDILRPGEKWGFLGHGEFGSNTARGLGSIFWAARPLDTVDLFAGYVHRKNGAYADGNGDLVPNTGSEVQAGIGKATFRPWDGHEIKLSATAQEFNFVTGQLLTRGNTGAESQYQSKLNNNTVSARWRYNKPDDNLFDSEGNVYWTQTHLDQLKIANGTAGSPGNPITGFVGDSRMVNIDTYGFNLHNTSRFELASIRNALTYGVDYFQDQVTSKDITGTGDLFTPSGKRDVYGGFVQLKSNYSTWLEWQNALRYDAYKLDGGPVTNEGDRISPKTTLGITPLPWLTVYGTYAEGYRAPAVTETLVAGAHPPFASFPGAQPGFTFVPNPSLKPEIGHTKEVGVNIRTDDWLMQGDKLRIKANVFQNDVDDFIEQFAFGPINMWGIPSFIQYRNVANARIEGVEGEATYDAGDWFAGVSGQHIRGRNVATDQPLLKIQPDQVAGTLGVRFLDRKLTMSVRYAHVWAKPASDIPDNDGDGLPDIPATRAYNLVKLYIGYEPTPDILASFTVDNLLNEQYMRYLDYLPAPGITYKGSLRIRFGA
ncbi:MAG: TonB-dependent hemoglobin/transferrin/lactoferrin family receptor [Rhizobiales bacterium]|nr:TonB-dependent hemoglobin/transferrin/lactoferrin family receptor [Hyphomicrobiales bacterium]